MRFTAWMVATEMMPEVMSYMWNTYLGPEYVNHMMERRREDQRYGNTYIGIPGRPPHKGAEIPNYQEALCPDFYPWLSWITSLDGP